MELVTRRDWMEHLIARAAGQGVTLFAPCVESASEIEGVLLGAEDFAVENEIDQLPLFLGFAGACPANPQLLRISPSGVSAPDGSVEDGDAVIGFQILTGLLKTYASIRGLFHRVVVMLYMDRAQAHADREIIENTHFLRDLCLVACDLSGAALRQAVERVKEYQALYGDLVMVEAVLDEPLSADAARALIEEGQADFVAGPADPDTVRDVVEAFGARVFLRSESLPEEALEDLVGVGAIGLQIPRLNIPPTDAPSNATPAMIHDARRRRYADAAKRYLRALGYERLGRPVGSEADDE